VPSFFPDCFEILYAGVPGIKQNKFGFKTTFFCLIQHIKEVIIFGFSVSIYIVNSKVNRYYSIIIGPDNSFEIDAIYNLMMFATPLPVNKINMFGIRFIENSIVDDKETKSWSDKILNFFP
jgi:hypothetical protein